MLLTYNVISIFIFLNIALSNADDSTSEDDEYYDDETTTKPKIGVIEATSKISGLQKEDAEYELPGYLKLRGTNRFVVIYHVVTCDGYILDIFRMKSHDKSVKPVKKHPVLLLHGMWQSSDRFVEQGRARGIAFKLQDLGYDVWLGNSRGNKYSRLHLYLEPDLYGEKYRFFNYSFEEIGLYDLPATVDYILEETESEQLHFIGHSQGATAFIVLNSLLPKYNAKFVGGHLLAPIGYQNHFSNEKIKTVAELGQTVYEMLLKLGILEVFPYNKNSTNNLYNSVDYCLGEYNYRHICIALEIDKHMNLDTNKFNHRDTQGGSIKQLAHFAQNIHNKKFVRWDFGPGQNKEHYGMFDPPPFDLKQVTVRTIVHYAPNDEMVDARDAVAMARDMSKGIARRVGRNNFSHRDFIDSPDVMECVFNKVIADLQNLDEGKDVEGSATKLCLSLLSFLLPILVTVLN
ncbi:lipase 3-like [Choristoneura fumiferana]|uniref:lipase 3-like n=1 Tax=Choristoneura fumiferana TaxID=7141 RepID=UPI003D153D0F